MPSEEPFEPSAATSREESATELTETAETSGTTVDRYKLLHKIGEGGMGEVWLAEQKEPIRRRVALKLIKAGMNSREVIARFESERQALALMDHPSIAKVLDAGSTAQGTPYFVMEYVAGVPITDYCDNHQLGNRDRQELFAQVCDAVQHAHQKAIIHRDLKPSNILVTEVDGRPLPKIIDFGVAKALTQKLIAGTMFTRVGSIVGTPEYMSPEQALSSGEDIDTRSDVYSLGVVFYELLAGVPPLQLRQLALDDFVRKLREEEPPKPSTNFRKQNAATSTEVARRRRSEPPELAKQLTGDLDWIALKALEKNRARRYGACSDFAADIRRHLNDEAVLAAPPSTLYRVGKFARRNRGILAAAAGFVVVLAVAAGVSIKQAMRADREAAVAQAVNDFLQNDLLAQANPRNQSSPSVKPDRDMKVRTALDLAARRIDGKFGKQPDVEAAIRDTMGQSYMDLGQYEEARKQLERSLALRRRTLGPNDPKTLQTMGRLGEVAQFQGKYSEAETLISRSAEGLRRVLGPKDPNTLTWLFGLSALYFAQQKYAQAEALDAEILEIRRASLGTEHPDTLLSTTGLAADYSEQGKWAQAERLDSQNLAIQQRVLGSEHPDTLMTMANLAADNGGLGRYAQAEDLYRQVFEIQRRVLGPQHPETLKCSNSLADCYEAEGKCGQAQELRRRALESDSNNGTLLVDLAWFLSTVPDHRMRRPKEALELATRASRMTRGGRFETWDRRNPYTTLGLADCRNSLWDEAIANLNRSRELNGTESSTAFFLVATAYKGRGDAENAEHWFRRAVNLAQKDASNDWELRMIWAETAELFRQPGPVPTYPEAVAEPGRVIASLKRALNAGYLKLGTLETSSDLDPLRGRTDFEAIVHAAHTGTKTPTR